MELIIWMLAVAVIVAIFATGLASLRELGRDSRRFVRQVAGFAWGIAVLCFALVVLIRIAQA